MYIGLTADAQCIFQFVIKGSDSYIVDLKNGEGSVKKGEDPKADVKFTYKSEEDFVGNIIFFFLLFFSYYYYL